MADKPVKPVRKIKRKVKNPETFRERALRTADTAGAKRRGTGRVFSPFAGLLRKFFGLKVFSPLGKILRPVGKILLPGYFRSSWQELRLVTWPNWRESRRLTFAVLVFAVVFGAAIAGVDWGLDKVFKNLLLK